MLMQNKQKIPQPHKHGKTKAKKYSITPAVIKTRIKSSDKS